MKIKVQKNENQIIKLKTNESVALVTETPNKDLD